MSRMTLRLAAIAILLTLALTLVFNSSSLAMSGDGNDQVVAWLRNDLAGVNNAQNYMMYLVPASPLPSTPREVATSYGYLGVDAGPNQTHFLQVGFTEDVYALRWFVFSYDYGITCTRGHLYFNGYGCLGDPNDFATLDSFQMVQMDTDLHGTWHAFLYNTQGQGVDVAHIYFGSNTAYNVFTSSEEMWTTQSDPGIMVRYYHFHPRYYQYPVGWTDWSCSGGLPGCQPGGHNYLNQAVCPPGWPYAAIINLGNDPRFWFAGTGGGTCNVNPLF